MINPALLKALIPPEVMDNVQNAAQAFIEMRNDINELKMMVGFLYAEQGRTRNPNLDEAERKLLTNGLSSDHRE